jgi:hypothetical protein
MKIEQITFGKAQRGWVCDLWFCVKTKRQYTSERHEVQGGAKGHSYISIILAYLNARKLAIAEAKRLEALPGEYT